MYPQRTKKLLIDAGFTVPSPDVGTAAALALQMSPTLFVDERPSAEEVDQFDYYVRARRALDGPPPPSPEAQVAQCWGAALRKAATSASEEQEQALRTATLRRSLVHRRVGACLLAAVRSPFVSRSLLTTQFTDTLLGEVRRKACRPLAGDTLPPDVSGVARTLLSN